MNAAKPKSEIKRAKFQVRGGSAPGQVLAQTAGGWGIQIKKVGESIKSITMPYEGLKIMVELIVEDGKERIEVQPSTSILIIEALREPPRDRKKVKNIKHDGDLSLSDILKIARQIRHKSYSKKFVGTVKEVLGTCLSVGCTVEGKSPKQVTAEINAEEIRIPDE